MTMLTVDQISKSFGSTRVLDRVSFSVPPGALTGFVGGNGAGKTTTMRIVMGLLRPESGRVMWDGRALEFRERRRFGYMPEERGLYPKQAVGEQLVYFGRINGLSARTSAARAADLLERFGLADRAGDTLETLSLGNQQRVQIATALIHEPSALILDEPFSGLDPDAVEAMAELIAGCASTGVPVLFSSHQLDLVERLCDRIVILSSGRVVAEGTRDELRASHLPLWQVEASGVETWLGRLPGVTVRELQAGRATFVAPDPDVRRGVLVTALERGDVRTFGEVLVPLSAIYQEATQ
jgi:ABC-2 type transport system ATP-binding protein